MKKALIVTYYCADNYGAYWQAYALGKYVKKCGFDIFYLRDFKMEHMLLSENKKYYKDRNEKLLCSINDEFNVVDNSDIKYDIAIIGSDEVWNRFSISHKERGQYWGNNIKAKKKISYAPCAVGVGIKRMFLKYFQLKKFDAISARDIRTKKVLERVLNKEVKLVLDPTFLIDYNDICKRIINDKYILLYSYGVDDIVVKYIKDFARMKNLKIIVSGYEVDWADYNIAYTPKEWISLFKYADFVVSTTFHGTVFSLIFEKQFILYGDNDKAEDLLSLFLLQNRKCIDYNQIQSSLELEIDYKEYRLVKESMLGQSISYLNQHCISNENIQIELYKDKNECCGCAACYSKCPVQAIYMVEDNEGFKYPVINKYKCIKCNNCIKVCPFDKLREIYE